MTGRAMDVVLEGGGGRVFASVLAWPGWCRSAKSEEGVLAALEDYRDRYALVATGAGAKVPVRTVFKVVERLKGSGATEFGIPDATASADSREWSAKEANRQADLVVASWDYLDDVVAGAPPRLRKGPRGGGRDRDQVAEHVAESQRSYARMLGIREKDPAAVRAPIEAAVRASRGGPAVDGKGWPTAYAVRRIVWHVLDHAWEIEDKS